MKECFEHKKDIVLVLCITLLAIVLRLRGFAVVAGQAFKPSSLGRRPRPKAEQT